MPFHLINKVKCFEKVLLSCGSFTVLLVFLGNGHEDFVTLDYLLCFL